LIREKGYRERALLVLGEEEEKKKRGSYFLSRSRGKTGGGKKSPSTIPRRPPPRGGKERTKPSFCNPVSPGQKRNGKGGERGDLFSSYREKEGGKMGGVFFCLGGKRVNCQKKKGGVFSYSSSQTKKKKGKKMERINSSPSHAEVGGGITEESTNFFSFPHPHDKEKRKKGE